MNFSNLKKNSGKFDNLLKEVEKINNPGGNYEKDETDNYWKPTPDKTGNADRKSTRLNSSHIPLSRMPSSA